MRYLAHTRWRKGQCFAFEAKGRSRSNLDHTSTGTRPDCIGGFVTNTIGRVGEPPTERRDSRLVVDSTHDLASQSIRGNVLDRCRIFSAMRYSTQLTSPPKIGPVAVRESSPAEGRERILSLQLEQV